MLKVLDGFIKYGYINLHAIQRIEYKEGGYRSFYNPNLNYRNCKDHSKIVGWPWKRKRVRANSHWVETRIILIMASGEWLFSHQSNKARGRKIYDNIFNLTKDLNGSCLYRSHGNGPERS